MKGLNKHLMTDPKGNSECCFPETLNVPWGEVEGNIEGRGETKLTVSRGISHLEQTAKNKQTAKTIFAGRRLAHKFAAEHPLTCESNVQLVSLGS